MSKNDGTVEIHGKIYETVALRVRKFRDVCPEFSLTTEIVERAADVVVIKATLTNDHGRVIATGHAEEFRASSQINKTSALENAETSAIGRALASFGLGGTEFATADEVANAIHQQGVHKPTDGAGYGLAAKEKQVVLDTAVLIKDYLKEGKDFDAYGTAQTIEDNDCKLFLWAQLDSKERSALKRCADAERKS